MKRLVPIVVCGLVVVGSAAAATAATGSRPAGYFVTGSARSAYPSPAGPGYSVLGVVARSRLSGAHPRGYVTVHGTTGAPVMGAFTAGGAVTCLRVSGHEAAIKYRFTRATGSAAAFRGGGVEVFIQDNGRPRDGHPVDATAFDPPQPAGAFDANAAQCDDPTAAAYNRVESGNYTVRRHPRPRQNQQ